MEKAALEIAENRRTGIVEILVQTEQASTNLI
jgi:hypothetical protein